MTEAKLNLQQACKYFSGKKILENINLELCPGDFLLLQGANGSGKSTLLKILADLLTIDSGQRLPAPNLSISYQGHDVALYQYLTVRENLIFFLKLQQSALAFEEVVLAWALADLLDQVVADLSKGQMARVALALSFATAKDILLLDEPTANLDDLALGILEKNIRQFLERRRDAILVIAAHGQIGFKGLSPRIFRLEAGGLNEPEVIYREPN